MHGLKAIVIGAGIGGLTTGIALRQAGYEVEIHDRVRELRPIGSGISLWSNGVKVLNRLGLDKKLAEIGGQMNQMEYRHLSGTLLNRISLKPLVDSVGQRPYPVARRDLQNILLDAFISAGGKLTLGAKCIGILDSFQNVTAKFEDGSSTTGDLLIAADGVRSLLRQYILGESVEPKYAGYVNWNGLVPMSNDIAPVDMWSIYVGEHKRASVMPLAGDRFYFFFDVPLPKGTPNDVSTYRQELKEHFQGWAEPVQLVIDRLVPETVARVEIHDVGPISRLVKGRVALLGDAAHATCPDLGQGGCQAIEDAWVLANYLISTNVSVTDALRRYENERKVRITDIVNKARNRAETIHGKDPEVTQKWYSQLATESPLEVTQAIGKIISGGPLH
ncbi:FAD-dependent urate hydroxylase HpxO [Pseudanabaena sp. FACHB-1998]|uniref:FAD-dependent urate hydroxylase HpxO n=1 Tax=Pseudanabaena sp. FACHB-1998 TaxID=2692858 RepID=UPI0016802635|nr:FAD-dependent urate hydroxylase HpxO [Pseudanabaena sp. FACHB-1998]MBD2176252.1 FAD-dependent urate hydroxylase HpxO [Pseudanabaena sp. FACHB-1998]